MANLPGKGLPACPGLIIKDSCWRWPERNLAGKPIDFHVQVLGLSFHDASSANPSESLRRNLAKSTMPKKFATFNRFSLRFTLQAIFDC
jgi:hypothetical protein